MSRRLVYITSRAHSGSTLLSLLLSGQPSLIALGEIISLLDFEKGHIFRQDEIRCSCGSVMRYCQFWGPVTGKLLKNQHLPLQDKYDLVINEFFNNFGEQCIPVDASKILDGIKLLIGNDIDLNVLFLLRDVRPWALSMRNDNIKKGDFYLKDLITQYGIKSPWEYMKRTTYKYFYHWYLLNRQTQKFLGGENIPTFQLGYEEITLYPEVIAGKICQFLGLDYDSRMLSLGASESHVLVGNRMKNQEEKKNRIFYDNRWFYSTEWQLPSILFPKVMKYNTREVYANTRNYLWQQ
jgi:hypothetical protein